jgi:ABC transport system ATP-binding/permease protein
MEVPMPLVLLKDVHLAFGGAPLLDRVSLTIEPGDRIGLLGRNGAGKSTLLRVIRGAQPADEGEVILRQGMSVAELAQEVPAGAAGTVFDVVADGLGELGELVREYHRLAHELEGGSGDLDRLAAVQHRLEAGGGWSLEQRIEAVIQRLSLDPDLPFAHCSGGLKRRVMLARALVRAPDLLLLDEPTNHLDLETILWLEEFLLNYAGALLFITHDRAFLRRWPTASSSSTAATSPTGPGTTTTSCDARRRCKTPRTRPMARFDKRLAQEETWIRQGIKARRTRNMGRVRQAAGNAPRARRAPRAPGPRRLHHGRGGALRQAGARGPRG